MRHAFISQTRSEQEQPLRSSHASNRSISDAILYEDMRYTLGWIPLSRLVLPPRKKELSSSHCSWWWWFTSLLWGVSSTSSATARGRSANSLTVTPPRGHEKSMAQVELAGTSCVGAAVSAGIQLDLIVDDVESVKNTSQLMYRTYIYIVIVISWSAIRNHYNRWYQQKCLGIRATNLINLQGLGHWHRKKNIGFMAMAVKTAPKIETNSDK